ncbi:MAG: type III pantothenate kinase [Coriobacteriia bacterium]|nr:type III pantothenate kinase [Coriobacteriia bacterium]
MIALRIEQFANRAKRYRTEQKGTAMLLAIDVGNTQTTLGLFDGEEMLHMWRISSDTTQSTDELRITLHGLLSMDGVSREEIDGMALATVVPAAKHMWMKVGRTMFGLNVLDINVRTAGDLIDITNYRRSVLGADRIADAVAARVFYGAPVIVVDFGTATNIEVIDKDGCFAGGVIAPGVMSSMNALFSRTALLPQVELVDPKAAIGRNTIKAMQVGIVYGEVDRVDGLVHRIEEQLGYKAKVVATGGLASTMAKLTTTVTEINPELTLQGIRLIYENQSK